MRTWAANTAYSSYMCPLAVTGQATNTQGHCHLQLASVDYLSAMAGASLGAAKAAKADDIIDVDMKAKITLW